MKLTNEDKKELVEYLDGAIGYLDKELKPAREQFRKAKEHIKRLTLEKQKLQKIRKAIK